MRVLQSLAPLLAFVLVVSVGSFSKSVTWAADVPADACSLLSSGQLEKILGQPFGAPDKTSAPPAYSRQAPGARCEYSSQKGTSRNATLIVYVNNSVAEAKETFAKLSVFYPPKTQVSGIGDSAYIDENDAIHVLKGKVRYYISLEPAATDKQLKDLASFVAAQI